MRAALPCRLALGLVLFGVAAGCRSLPGPPPLLDGGLVVSSAPLPPDREQAARALALYSLGIHHEMADEYDLACDAYRQAAALDPGNERLVLRIASTLVLQRKPKEALAVVEAFLERQPASGEALRWLASFYGTTGEHARVAELYRRLTRLQPENPLGWLQLAAATARAGGSNDVERILQDGLARAFLAMDDQPKAIALLEDIARRENRPADVHYYLAELYLQSGDAATAAVHFRAAADAAPGDPAPWLKLAALQADSSADTAVATLTEALGRIPGDPKLLELFALVRMGQKRYADAADLFQQAYDAATAKDPDAPPSNLFFYNCAVLRTHLRQTAAATDWLRRALEQDPLMLDLYLQRAMTGTATFRKSAIAVLRALAKLPGTETAAIHAHLASLHLAQNDAARAVREFEAAREIIKRDPLQAPTLTPRFYFWFGVALDQEKQTDRAVEMFETCISLDPAYADALNYLAYLWAVRGERLDEALRLVQTALSLEPENPAYLDTLGWVYYQQGRFQEALDLLLQADALQPNDPEILGHIEKTREKLAPAP